MNAAISFVVAVVSVLIVVVCALVGIKFLLGQWAILAWIGLGWFGFLAVMKAVNA
jgi:hypothetical protein